MFFSLRHKNVILIIGFLENICIVTFVAEIRGLYQLILLIALTIKVDILELKKVIF